jgi:hypothetical protein
METTSTIVPEHPQLKELLPKMQKLEAALLANDPQMANYLKDIHKHLIQYEELAHLLSEDQIAVILEGQQKKIGVILAAETTKSKQSTKIKGGITADDL